MKNMVTNYVTFAYSEQIPKNICIDFLMFFSTQQPYHSKLAF